MSCTVNSGSLNVQRDQRPPGPGELARSCTGPKPHRSAAAPEAGRDSHLSDPPVSFDATHPTGRISTPRSHANLGWTGWVRPLTLMTDWQVAMSQALKIAADLEGIKRVASSG